MREFTKVTSCFHLNKGRNFAWRVFCSDECIFNLSALLSWTINFITPCSFYSFDALNCRKISWWLSFSLKWERMNLLMQWMNMFSLKYWQTPCSRYQIDAVNLVRKRWNNDTYLVKFSFEFLTLKYDIIRTRGSSLSQKAMEERRFKRINM